MIFIYVFLVFSPIFSEAAQTANAKPPTTQAKPTTRHSAYSIISEELTQKCSEKDNVIVIADFSYQDGHDSIDGSVIANRLTTEIVKSKKCKVIERKELDRIFSELKLQRSGAIDTDSVKEIGKMLGANLVIVGSLTDLPNKMLELNARAVNAESGEILTAASARIQKDWIEPRKEEEKEPELSPTAIETSKVKPEPKTQTTDQPQTNYAFSTRVFLGETCGWNVYYEGDGSFRSWNKYYPTEFKYSSYISAHDTCGFADYIDKIVRYKHPELKEIWKSYKKDNNIYP